jgi:U3 small nucleolar RNA-associated protein 22
MDRNAVIVTKNFAWKPSVASPEWVVVTRAVALAKRSYGYIMQRLVTFDNSSDWSAIFHESPTSFQSYSVLFRVSDDLVIDQEASSTGGDLNPMANEDGILETSYTRSMKARAQGPKGLRRKVYKNLQVSANDPADQDSMLLCWQPIESVVSSLRQKFGGYALFFYNELAPEVIGLVWRPSTFKAMPFSAMTAEHAKPQEDRTNEWRNDSFVVRNATDLLREMSEYYQDVITTAKIIDESCLSTPSKKRKIAQ